MLGWQFKRPDNSSLSPHSAAASSDCRAQISGAEVERVSAQLPSWEQCWFLCGLQFHQNPSQDKSECGKPWKTVSKFGFCCSYLEEILRGRERERDLFLTTSARLSLSPHSEQQFPHRQRPGHDLEYLQLEKRYMEPQMFSGRNSRPWRTDRGASVLFPKSLVCPKLSGRWNGSKLQDWHHWRTEIAFQLFQTHSPCLSESNFHVSWPWRCFQAPCP